MNKSKDSKIALLNFVGKTIGVTMAPITLLIISKKLSIEDISYYYTFFSLISLQQLAEVGVGHVIMQHIAHAYKKKGVWAESSKSKVRDYFKLSQTWFTGVSIFIILAIGVGGFLYLDTSKNDVDWKIPWCLVVVSSALITYITPYLLLLDGIQRQITRIKANIISSILGSIIIVIALMNDAGLYSIAISQTVSLLTLYLYIHKDISEIKSEFKVITKVYSFNQTWSEIKGLLLKVSITCALGVFFWNSFTLISFNLFQKDIAGKIIFAVAIARSGFFVAESITQSQSTMFANLIANKKEKKVKIIFLKYSRLSMTLLFIGYSLFLGFWMLQPNFYIFEKLPDKFIVVQVFFFYTLQLFKQLKTNYVRCYKVEPFLKVSIFEATLVPITFLIASMYSYDYMFAIASIPIAIGAIWSIRLSKEFIRVKNDY